MADEQSKNPRIRIGQEAVDAYEGSESLVQKVEPDTSCNKPEVSDKPKPNPVPGAINRPLMQCYPEIADDDNETLLADVRRHWLGRVAIFAGGGILILLLIMFAAASPSLLNGAGLNVSTSVKGIIGLASVVVAVLIGLGTLVMLWIYNQNHMLITNENVIEVRQINLFSKKVSHLNMINVEDVTVLKKGVLQTAFNYGTMSIETAGEKDNFSFINTPTPDTYRRMVISAHEDAIDRVGRLGNTQRVMINENGL